GAGAGRVLQLRLPREPGRLRHPQRGSHSPRMAGHQDRGQGQARASGGARRCRSGAGAFARSPRRGSDGERLASHDFTWAWVLRDEPDGTSRLLVRERYAYTRPWARFIVEPVEVIDFVMTQKMLRGIKNRAGQTA